MELLSSIRESKLFYLGLPALLLVLYAFLIPSPSVSQIHLQGDLGYIAEGYDFTILRLSQAGQITRLSSSTLPYRIKNFTVENKQAYVITGDNSIHIIDVNDPSKPKRLSEWNSPGIVHSVAISGGFAYVANDMDGVRILSVNNPYSPSEIMLINNLGTILDVATSQNLIYLARGLDGLDIYDMSGLSQSASKGHYKADGSINQITLLPENRALLLVNNNQVQIINFGNLQNIGLESSFAFENEIAHAVVSGKKILIAQKSAGLLIGRIKDDGTLESLTNISIPLSKVMDVASIENTIFLAAGYRGLRPAEISKLDAIQFSKPYSRFFDHKGFVGILIVAVLLFWLSFFAQFVLPVRTFIQRQKIFGRLLLFLIGKHGPATRIENGVVQAQLSERQRKSPGVLWLDTASATVIRTETAFKEAIGPGVHFTRKNEFIAGTVDLHTQVDSLGPGGDDENPFMPKPDADADPTEKNLYDKIQKQRMEVSALTRDGIEVVPKISVTFRVDTLPAEGNKQPGSRFGYRTGTSKTDKKNEANDKEAIYNAIAGEGINPYVSTENPRHRVAWNHLPILLAVDVWREYVAKFTLDELFEATQEVPPELPALPLLANGTSNQAEGGNSNGAKQGSSKVRNALALRDLNDRTVSPNEHEDKNLESDGKLRTEADSTSSAAELSKKTALQVINEMVKARLTFCDVEMLDATGHRTGITKESSEYQLLTKRGLKVLNVSISNPRVDEFMEKQLINQWTASWLNNAKAEHDRIDRQRGFVEIQIEEQSMNEYVHALARHIIKLRPKGNKETIKALLIYTRLMIVRNNHLQKRMSTEREEIEEILQWMENTS